MREEIRPNPLKPRWSKVFADLWVDKTRTGLVAASIAVGVFAIGMILTAYMILKDDINLSYASTNPANIEIWTDPFDENLLRIIKDAPGVGNVESRFIITVRAKEKNKNWQSLQLIGVDDFEESQINQLEIIDGVKKPGTKEVVVSQDLLNFTGFEVGDEIEIYLPDGARHFLKVAGLIVDQTTAEPDPGIIPNGYITLDTMRSLGIGEYANHLFITVVGNGGDSKLITEIANQVEDLFDRNKLEIYRIDEALSTEHPMSDTLLAVIGVLGALGGLVTNLSSSLIINMLNSLLTQQLRQIGVMKLIGGRSFQILGMYLTLIVAYSIIALLVAVPMGAIAGNALAGYIASMLGAVLQGYRIVPVSIIIQLLVAFLVPLGAGFFPVNQGAKTNVRRAISNYRPNFLSTGKNIFNRSSLWVQWISRPILMSFRNTFRQKRRLMLTIFTLTISGAVFIAVFNVRSSMNNMMNQLMQHFMGDVTINFNHPYQVNLIERSLLNAIPEIDGIEGWGGASAEIWDKNDDLVTGLSISAPPQDTQLLELDLLAGRWFGADEQNTLVISDSIYNIYPNLEIGDRLIVKFPGNLEESWEVVGIFRFVDMFGDPMAYANFDIISEKVNLPRQTTSFRVITDKHTASDQLELVQKIDQFLVDRNFAVKSVESGASLQESASQGINTLIIFLLIMALLTAFVGSIGLTGTMSINVLERTREIGVMRTIGAVDKLIMQSVIIEALVIGSITWVLAIGISFPISKVLLDIIGETMAGSVMQLTFNPNGLLLWLAVVIVLSLVSSIMPARKAAKLTINEVLAYE